MISCFKYFVILVVYFLSNLVFAGPGRSGGENGIITDPAHIQNSIHAIDIIETDQITPIHDFEKELPGFSSFNQLLTKLKNFNSDLPEYLSEVFTKKQWYFIDAKINNAQCENGTLLDTAPENKIIIVCQFQDKVFVNKKAFPSSSLSQLTLLVHEGLVNQMLKYLISIIFIIITMIATIHDFLIPRTKR